MTRATLALGALAALLVAGRCVPPPTPVPPPDDAGADVWAPPLPDSGPDPVTLCQAAGAKLGPPDAGGLGCTDEMGLPLWVGPPCAEYPDGQSFASRCVDEYLRGTELPTACIANITSCSDLASCGGF